MSCALVVSACAPSISNDPLARPAATPSCVSAGDRPVELSATLVPGFDLAVQSDEVARLHVSIPVLPDAPALNRRLEDLAAEESTAYRRQAGATGGGDFNVSWSLAGVSPAMVGVTLRIERGLGTERATAYEVVWYDRASRQVLQPTDLFTAGGWSALSSRLLGDVCVGRVGRTAALREALAQPGGAGTSIGFSRGGDAIVSVREQPGQSSDDGVVAAVDPVSLAPWLSGEGRAAALAATSPEPLPAPTATGQVGPGLSGLPPATVTKPGTRPSTGSGRGSKGSGHGSKGQGHGSKAAAHHGAGSHHRVDCRRQRCVALTFDDGPGPSTARLLTILQRTHTPATFFLMGEHVTAFPALTRQIARSGAEVGNHSYTHPDLTTLTAAEIDEQLARTSAAIERATGHRPRLLRPPYGAHNALVDRRAAAAGLAEVMWNLDTLDWKHQNAKSVRKATLRDVHRGSIVLLHDIHPTTVDAVPKLIQQLRDRGYTLVTVSDLLGPTRPGAAYYGMRR